MIGIILAGRLGGCPGGYILSPSIFRFRSFHWLNLETSEEVNVGHLSFVTKETVLAVTAENTI